jgi:CRP-like cAMP-binding protein
LELAFGMMATSRTDTAAPESINSDLSRRNKILSGLSEVALRHLTSGADQVGLEFGQVLYEAGQVKRFVYFPTGAYISQVSSLSGVPRLEVGLVGMEGMVGSSLLFGIDDAPLHTVVQGAGTALRLDVPRFAYELGRGPALRATISRYLYVRLSQLGQMAACARFHTVEQRLSRWLLMTRDRARSDMFHLTHEYLASMLGVRRVGITEAATALHDRKLISYSRGTITIVDGRELENVSCECYATAERTYEKFMN